ncbi:arsenate reductase ArsC [Clostridia bacterium]|nr:arsenate reductase ArsC [Clostridia bacterium]
MKIGYICIGNSCRSQMAEGLTNALENTDIEVYSAGTHPTMQVNPKAVKVMEEIGLDISMYRPKKLENIPDLDIVVTMGCGVECPMKLARYRIDWQIDDPVGKDIDFFRNTRNEIKNKVLDLLKQIEEGKYA